MICFHLRMKNILKNIYLFIYYQKYQLLIITTVVLLPYGLISYYLPSIPYMHYFFLISLFLTKFFVFNDTQVKKNLMPKVQSRLTKELKQNPSRDLIFKRIDFILLTRNLTLVIGVTGIIAMAIIFQKF